MCSSDLGLNVTVLSYEDRVDVGFMACRETVPGLWAMADAVPAATAELLAAARAVRAEHPSARGAIDLTEAEVPAGVDSAPADPDRAAG